MREDIVVCESGTCWLSLKYGIRDQGGGCVRGSFELWLRGRLAGWGGEAAWGWCFSV